MDLYLVKQGAIFNYCTDPAHTRVNSANEEFIKRLADTLYPVHLGGERSCDTCVCTFGRKIPERLTEGISKM